MSTGREHVRMFDCGLGGMIRIHGLTEGRTNCEGSLSDWNPATCSVKPSLLLTMNNSDSNTTTQPRGRFYTILLVFF